MHYSQNPINFSLEFHPPLLYDSKNAFEMKEGTFGLANVAPTIAQIFGINAPECWEEGMIKC